jgi:hypothetical protein
MRALILLAFVSIAGCNPDDVTRSVGARCESVDECDDRCLGPSTDYPDGFCSVDCTTSGDCPAGECVDREGGVCLFTCRDADDCRFLGPGWTCLEDSLRGSPDQKVMVCRG